MRVTQLRPFLSDYLFFLIFIECSFPFYKKTGFNKDQEDINLSGSVAADRLLTQTCQNCLKFSSEVHKILTIIQG